MQLLLQYRKRWVGIGITLVTFAVLLLFHQSANSMLGVYLILAVPLQFCISGRWLWGVILPISMMVISWVSLMLKIPTGFYRILMMAPVLVPVAVLVTIAINVGLNIRQRVRVRQYAKQVNESGMTESLYISDKALTNSGLDNSERAFFKREVRNAYHQLEYLRDIRREVVKYIPSYDDDLRLIEQTFQELLSAPRELLNISDFMYSDLPDYVSLAQGLDRMSNNLVAGQNDQVAISHAQAKLVILSKKLQDDYVTVTAHESEELMKKV